MPGIGWLASDLPPDHMDTVTGVLNFFYSLDGVKLSSLGTPATSGPIVPAPDDK